MDTPSYTDYASAEDFFEAVRHASREAERTRLTLLQMEAREGARAQTYAERVSVGGERDRMAQTDARMDYEGRMRERIEADLALLVPALDAAAGGDDPAARAAARAALLALGTGARVGELCALRRRDHRSAVPDLSVAATMVEAGGLHRQGLPKGSRPRRVTLSGEDEAAVLAALAELGADPGHPMHGTMTGYRYGCRCERCRAARHEYHVRTYASKRRTA